MMRLSLTPAPSDAGKPRTRRTMVRVLIGMLRWECPVDAADSPDCNKMPVVVLGASSDRHHQANHCQACDGRRAIPQGAAMRTIGPSAIQISGARGSRTLNGA